MATTFLSGKNLPEGTISDAGGISDTDLTFSLQTSEGAEFATGPEILLLTDDILEELVLKDSRSGDTFTLNASGRGYGGTTAQSWAQGTYVRGVVAWEHFTEIHTAINALENQPDAPGVIKPYAGFSAPSGYLLCAGTAVSRTTYSTLLSIITITQTGSATNGSAIITGLSDTSDMRVGAAAEGTGIPSSTTVLTIDSGTQITLSANATATGSPSLTFFPYGAGDGSTTFNIPDLRGRMPIGIGQGASLTNRVAGQTGGEETHVLTEAELASHQHDFNVSGGSGVTDPATGKSLSGSSDNTSIVTYNSSAPNTTLHADTISAAGSDTAHNNMPPYIAVNYIIKT